MSDSQKDSRGAIPRREIPAEENAPPAATGFVGKFTVIFGAKRELWLTFLIKFLIYTAYSVTNKTLVLWLSRDLGFSDQASGALVGWVWAPAMTVFTLLSGSLTDAIGLRRTFFLGVAICTVARSVMIGTTMPALALACGVLPLAIGEALGTPVLLAATRVYSTTRQRSMAFSIIYAIMNLGYIAAGYIFDYVRRLDWHLSIGSFHPTPHQELFMVSLAFEVLLFPTIYFLRRDAEPRATAIEARTNSGFFRGIGETVRRSAVDTSALFRRLVGQSGLYRLLLFFLLIGFLKALFLQMDYVFPKFGDRVMGFDAPVGRLTAINGWIVIVLAPLIGALTQRMAAYRMVIIGGAVCTAGVFVMAMPTNWFVPAASGGFGQWLGHDYLGLPGAVHPYYVMSAIYLVIYSIGESIYSPRVYEYAAAIAPPGQEASYGSLAYLPFLVGKLLIGFGGWMLAAFVPATGAQRPATMWLIFAASAAVAPIGLLIFRNYIQVREVGREASA